MTAAMWPLLVIFIDVLSRAHALRAPTILEHPPEILAYRVGESVTLQCLADKESNPTYQWKKNGVLLSITGNMSQPQGTGNLVIRTPTVEDEGVFQCFASNAMGSAVTVKSVLKMAFFYPFPTVQDPRIFQPLVGESLSIPCTPPLSYPQDVPYWGISKPGNKDFQTLNNDNRIMLDYEGHLYFANILESDAHGDLDYICILTVLKLAAHMHGNNHKIRPRLISDGPQYHAPHLMWSSNQTDVAIKGQNKKLKCIYGGYPTPQVTWRRVDSRDASTSRLVVTREGHGTEIEIRTVEETDSGEYECSATNSNDSTLVSQRIKLIVESKPLWSGGRSPSDVQVEEGDDAEFLCSAEGTPRPEISWAINGVEIENLPRDSRIRLDGDRLQFSSVTKNDTAVLQCMAENKHGVILANAHLTVISEPPSFTKTPIDKKALVDSNVKFQCRASGAPKPVIKWQRGNPPRDLIGRRFLDNGNGDLEIMDVSLDDEDVYYCAASNKHETTRVSATLAVRVPTVIGPSPSQLNANKSDDITLPCDVTSDSREVSNLKVVWKKDGVPVDYALNGHLSMDSGIYSLRIRNSKIGDTASYTCHADNGVDRVESSPRKVIVRDRPEPPTNLRMDSCSSYIAEVSFIPGYHNNDPVTSFTIYYKVDDGAELIHAAVIDWQGNGASGVESKNDGQMIIERISARINVQPWRRYIFYVAATNSLGTSEPSTASSDICSTPESKPSTNPENVCVSTRGSGELVITWDPVPRELHNGAGFRYVVSYTRMHSQDEPNIIKTNVSSSVDQVRNVTIPDLPVFTAYLISVWAENNVGESPYWTRQRKIGHSGEGKPLVVPKNFRLDGDRYNATSAEFTWDAVDISSPGIRGYFKGYRIKFWRIDNPNGVRTEDILTNRDINLCPAAEELPELRPKRHVSLGPVYGTTHKLWPYSKIRAGVSVLNAAQEGPMSETIEFDTPEGSPEPVRDLRVEDYGSSHVTVTWSPPEQSNGIIVSYVLQYQVAPPSVGSMHDDVLEGDLKVLRRKISDLQDQTVYRITVYAVTRAGRGQPIYIDQSTLPDSAPDKPMLHKIEAGLDSANVTFLTTADPPKQNPGSKYYIEYTKEEFAEVSKWNRTALDPQATDNWVHVRDLEPGLYYFRAVAVNGRHDHYQETRSAAMKIIIGEPREYEMRREASLNYPVESASASIWFIVLMCIIVLLLAIMFIVCFVRRSQGDVYPVFEKENELGRGSFVTDEVPIGEYNHTAKPAHTVSQSSLSSADSNQMEYDEESLGEYDEQDTSKFNEDGSFIGLYTGDGKRKSHSAMNTFV